MAVARAVMPPCMVRNSNVKDIEIVGIMDSLMSSKVRTVQEKLDVELYKLATKYPFLGSAVFLHFTDYGDRPLCSAHVTNVKMKTPTEARELKRIYRNAHVSPTNINHWLPLIRDSSDRIWAAITEAACSSTPRLTAKVAGSIKLEMPGGTGISIFTEGQTADRKPSYQCTYLLDLPRKPIYLLGPKPPGKEEVVPRFYTAVLGHRREFPKDADEEDSGISI